MLHCSAQNSQRVAPTLIEWQKESSGFMDAIANDDSHELHTDGTLSAWVLDFNGDGISDLAYIKDKGRNVLVDLYGVDGVPVAHLNTGVPSVWMREGTAFIPIDVDGDGRTQILVPNTRIVSCPLEIPYCTPWITNWNIIGYEQGQVVIDTKTISGTTDSDLPTRENGLPIIFDADGDGLHDMLYPKSTGLTSNLHWLLLRNTGDGSFSEHPTGLHGAKKFQVRNANGDGMQDLFEVNDELWLSTGKGFELVRLGWSNPDRDEASFATDINGDGCQDLVWMDHGNIQYRLNKGGTQKTQDAASFGRQVTAAAKDQDGDIIHIDHSGKNAEAFYVQVMDYNHDGSMDLLVPKRGGKYKNRWVAFIARRDVGDGVWFEAFNTGIRIGKGYKHNPQLADFNGDGQTDLLHSAQDRWQLRRHAGEQGNLVKRITAGRTRGDHRIDIGYQPLTRDAVHIKSTDADYPLIRDFQGPMCVVTQTEQDNGIGGYEQITKADGIVEHRHSIGAGGQTVAVKVIPSNGTEEIRSIHTDHLWSIDTITNQSQQVIERLSYSAWGKNRQAGWQDATIIIQSLESS